MDEELFGDLVQSLKEAKDICQGNTAPSRIFHVDVIDVKAIREKTGLTQEAFATAIQVSFSTLQDWKQNRRHPTGPAAALLKVLSSAPDMVLKALAV
ncbi:MAG: NadS family protein [Janthinobacterium lividum]